MPGDAHLLLHLRIVGIIMAVLVVVNLDVPRRFNWRDEMSRLSLLNRQIFQAHTVFLVLLLAPFSALLLLCAPDLLQPTRLSRAVLIGLTTFWGLRMVMQWGFYSPAIWGSPVQHGHALYVFGDVDLCHGGVRSGAGPRALR
jgi:hypothetical protein